MLDFLPSVSIVLATSNRAESLARTLNSIQQVDYPVDRLEVLVIDDGSRDNTRDVVQSLMPSFSPIPLLCHSLPKGNIVHARNRGVDEATGDVIVFTDDDCTFDGTWLSTLVQPLANEKVGAVGGGDCAPPELTPFESAVDYAFTSFLGVGGVRHGGPGRRAARYVPRGCNMAVRRKVMAEIGPFDSQFFNGEEIDIDYRIEKAGYQLVYQEGCAVHHHRRATWRGLARQVFDRGRTRRMLFRKHPEFFEFAYTVPAIAVAGLVLLLIASLFSVWGLLVLTLGVTGYAVLLLLGGLHAAVIGHSLAAGVRIPAVLALMHLSYGAGYWRGLSRGSAVRFTGHHALRCLISNDGFGLNQGDRAILQVMRNDLQGAFPGVTIRGFLNSWVPGPAALLRFWRDLRWADVFILGGGQVLHDQTCLLFLVAGLLKLKAAMLVGTPFVCYGIGVGPLQSRIGRRAVFRLLRHAKLILVRDHASRQLLTELGLPSERVRVTADQAFRLPLPPPEEVDSLARRFKLDRAPRPCVAICPRRWFHYAHHLFPARWRMRRTPPSETAAFSDLLDDLARVADRLIAQGGSVWLIPMKISRGHDPGQDDDDVCREIRDRMNQPNGARILDEDLPPSDLAALLTRFDAVVTMRMHAAILSALRGTPAVGIALAQKFTDCFAQLGQSERLIPAEEANGKALTACLDAALSLNDADRHALQEAAARLAEQAGENVKALSKWAATHSIGRDKEKL